MFVGEFSVADIVELDPFWFEFRKRLAKSETIASVTFDLYVIDGIDATPATRLIGPATISGSKVSQRVADLVPGTTYMLQATVTTNQGNIKSLRARVTCEV